MSFLFLSHSSQNDYQAIALQNWLAREGWDEIFLDLDPERGIVAGERWERALHEAANRCDAVLFLVSQAWLDSQWCRKEFHLAHRLNKRIIGLLIEDLAIEDLPEELTAHWQLVNLASGQDHDVFPVVHPDTGAEQHVHFSRSGLTRLRAGLVKAGLDPRYFEWPPANDPERPPYRGMRPLEAEDAGIFFGREAPIIDLLARLRGLREDPPPRFLVILGASGAGKSSFLRAGILPRLARDERNFLPLPIVRPGQSALWGDDGLLASLTQSFKAHHMGLNRKTIRDAIEQDVEVLIDHLRTMAEKATLPAASGEQSAPPTLVLSIDQGEELFQSEGRDEAEALLALLQQLTTQPDLPLVVLFAIRSDAYERLQTARELEGLQQQTFSLAPMPQGAFARVIEGPAERLKGSDRPLKIEPALTQQLLEDLDKGGSKDALPLLAFTMERLYLDYGDDGDLRLDEYQAMDGIEGAIEAAVEQAFKQALQDPTLPNERKALQALLRRGLIPWLAGIDPDTQGPKRRVARLHEIPDEARPMVNHLIQQRLLATDVDQETQETTLEPAHEALLRQWGLLRGWLEEDFAALSSLEGVRRASRDWEANARGEDWLSHSAGRLEDAEQLKQREDLARSLSRSDWDYLKACRERDDAQRNRELEEARKLAEAQTREAEAQRRAKRRTQWGMGVACLLLVIAVGLAGLAEQQRRESEIQRQRAEDLLASVRQNLNFMNFDLRQALKHYVPTEQRLELTREIDALLDVLASEVDSADASETDLRGRAAALLGKADVILQSSEADPADAAPLLNEAHALFQRLSASDPGNTLFLSDLAASHAKLGNLALRRGDTGAAHSAYQESLTLSEKLVELDPENTGFLYNLAASYDGLGDLARRRGDTDAAQNAHQQMLTIFEKLVELDPGNTRFLRDLAYSHNRLGDLARRRGDTQAAHNAYQEGLTITQNLVELDPENTLFLHDLSFSRNKLGDLALRRGDTGAAHNAYQESLTISEKLVELDPGNTQFLRDLAVSHNNLGDLTLRRGDTDAAHNAYSESLTIRKKLVELDPENTEFLRDLSISHNKLGDLALRRGDTEAAHNAYQESLTISEKLVELDPGNTEFHRDVAVSHYKMYDLNRTLENWSLAETSLRNALDIFRRMKTRGILAPDDERFIPQLEQKLDDLASEAQDRAIALADKANIILQISEVDPAHADPLLNEAHAIFQRLSASDPENTGFLYNLSVSHEKLGNLALRRGDTEAAHNAYQKNLTIVEKLVELDPGNTQFLRDLSLSHDKLGKLALRRGDTKAAHNAYSESLTIRQKLVELDPQNTQFLRGYMVSHYRMYDLHKTLGNWALAEASLRIALGVLRRMKTQGTLAPDDERFIPHFEEQLEALAARTETES